MYQFEEMITPSEVIEYLYCPRFIYYMKCLQIPQNEQKRYKVLKGREVHGFKSNTNKEYLRKRLNCIKKDNNVFLYSDRLGLKGRVDEVLHFKNGTMAPLDFKFAEYKGVVYSTYRIQALIYGLLITETYGKDVNKGYLCYTRSKNLLVEINFTKNDFSLLDEALDNYRKIIGENYYPKATKYKSRCIDCCYKNICVEGLEMRKSLDAADF